MPKAFCSPLSSSRETRTSNRCALFRRNRYESNVGRGSVGNNGIAVRSVHILHPIRDGPEHRDDIPFPGDSRDHQGICTDATGYAIADFQRYARLRRQSKARPEAEQLTNPVPKPRRATVAVKQAIERAALGGIGLGEGIASLNHWR